MDLVLSLFKDLVLTFMGWATILFAIVAFYTKRLVQAVLAFVQMVICFSVMLLLYKPIYVGVLYIIVYIGAVAVLFLFVLMLVNLREEAIDNLKSSRKEFQVSAFQYSLGLIFTTYIFLMSVKTSTFVSSEVMDIKSWLDLSAKTTFYSLFETSNNFDLVSYQSYINFWSETYAKNSGQIILMLLNLMQFENSLDCQFGVEFLRDLSIMVNQLGINGLRELIIYIMSDLQNNISSDILYQFKGLEDSTKLVSPLFTDKYSNILFGSGSLLLLALIGSVYITKEAI